jgi:hypothetical protein
MIGVLAGTSLYSVYKGSAGRILATNVGLRLGTALPSDALMISMHWLINPIKPTGKLAFAVFLAATSNLRRSWFLADARHNLPQR